MRLLTYCLMSHHWHLVLWPREDGDLSRFMQWLTVTHVRRRHVHRRTDGHGHLYQGRFKSFPIQADEHLLTVCRYVERNPLRAGMVKRAEDWRWSGLRRWIESDGESIMLSEWPVDRARGWRTCVNRPQNAAEEEAMRRCIARGQPYGGEKWTTKTADRLGLGSSLRRRGRPRKST